MVVTSRRSRRSEAVDAGSGPRQPQELPTTRHDGMEPLDTFSLLDFAPDEISKLPVLFAFDPSNKESRKRAIKQQKKFASNRHMKLYLTIHEDLDDAPWCDTRVANQDDIDTTPSHILVEAYDVSVKKPKKKKSTKTSELSSVGDTKQKEEIVKSPKSTIKASKAKSSKPKGKLTERKSRSASLPPTTKRLTRSGGDVDEEIVDVEKILSKRGKKATKPASRGQSRSLSPNRTQRGTRQTKAEDRSEEATPVSSSPKKRTTRNSSGSSLPTKAVSSREEKAPTSRRATRTTTPSSPSKPTRASKKRKPADNVNEDDEEDVEVAVDVDKKKAKKSSAASSSTKTTRNKATSNNNHKPITSIKGGTREVMTSIPAPEPIFADQKGWIREEVLRVSGSTTGGVDKYWYSPVTRQRFKSLVGCQRFLNCLIVTKGDEVAAMKIYKGQGL